ncbi:hypothetical protein [Staphylococcus xylosus]
MLEDKDDIRFSISIKELSTVLSHSQFETKTVSLIFVQMDLRYNVLVSN